MLYFGTLMRIHGLITPNSEVSLFVDKWKKHSSRVMESVFLVDFTFLKFRKFSNKFYSLF